MAKIIRLTEQDLYRIVKRVLNEELIKENNEEIFKDCVIGNLTFTDYAKFLLALTQCPSCAQVILKTGIGVLQEKQNQTIKDKVIAVVLNDPEIKELGLDCGGELLKYYKTLTDAEKTQLNAKITGMLTCVANKVFAGVLIPTEIPNLPDPSTIPGMDDIINQGIKTGTEMMGTITDIMGGGVQPKYSK